MQHKCKTRWRGIAPMLALALALVLSPALGACGTNQLLTTKQVAATDQAATAEPAISDTSSATAEIPDVTSVAYLGPAGTYTEEAAKLFFGANDELMPQETATDALAKVVDESAAYAIIPQENTLGGTVAENLDALLKAHDLHVVGEVVLPIRQTLMGISGTDLSKVKTVYSHKQGLAQSDAWLSKNLPDAKRVETNSTAAAAKKVAEGKDKTAVAIAAPGAAELYKLEVLQNNISQSEANKTRFYVVSRTANALMGYDHAVLMAECTADELPPILDTLTEGGADIVCVHDLPEGSTLGSYRYLVELRRPGGFTETELERINTIDQVTCLGTFCSVEG